MKYTILLDSSNTSLTVGVADEEKLIDSISYEAWQCQSEHMIPSLDELLVKFNIGYQDIKDVVVAIGPGSYTGVRIALTIAKTIALATNCDVYPVSSLRIQKSQQKPSICVINARSGRSYFGVYEDKKVIEPDQILTNDLVLEYIRNHPDYVVCGHSEYLKIEGYMTNLAEEMFSLKECLEKSDNPLLIKPVYMKD